MACFVAPATAAIAMMAVSKKVPAKYHLDWLLLMFWGGTVMLIVDHIISGEVVFQFPFFTAGQSKIWQEILQAGVPMVAAIFAVWGIMVAVANYRRRPETQTSKA